VVTKNEVRASRTSAAERQVWAAYSQLARPTGVADNVTVVLNEWLCCGRVVRFYQIENNVHLEVVIMSMVKTSMK